MEKIQLVFPMAAIAFILLVFSDYFACLRKPAEGLTQPAEGGFGRSDRIVIVCVTVFYALSAFLNLGGTAAPQSFCRFDSRGEYAQIELEEGSDVGTIVYYTGLHTGNYYLQFSADGENWEDSGVMSQGYASLFKWQSVQVGESGIGARYMRLIADDELWLGELAVYDLAGERLDSAAFSYPEGCAPLFDEQDTVPEAQDYLNSSYFDEIYHVRTAYEHIEGEQPYEISHPPLGKLIISLGIRLFGLTPFGWRFSGALFGCAMLPLIYVFVKRLFGGVAVPACVTVLMASDFMHFTQTRIATIDTYAVFFIILMYLFMYIYLQSDREGGRRSYLVPLALSGLCFGLGAASKWTCIYAGAGLGIVWLIDRVERGIDLRRKGRWEDYVQETAENVGCCLVFFVAVPLIIYYLSYHPYGRAAGMSGIGMYFSRDYLDIVVDNQKYMFSYHSGVDATHPYSSRWWQWVLNLRPILYYLEYFPNGTKSTIGAFVNPMLCWGGLAAMLAMAYFALRRGDKKARFILIGYLAQLLPWVFVERITFEYHYFPSTVFLLLALGHVFDCVRRRHGEWKRVLFTFTAVSVVLFAVYYPVLSGTSVSTWYAESFLGWFESWPF